MSEHVAALARRWFEEVWNQGREATIDELLAPECVAYGLIENGGTIGPPEFKLFWRNMRAAVPDVRVDVEDVIEQGDRAAVRIRLTGTHTGEGLGFPPSGGRLNVPGIIVIRVRNGRAVEVWNSWDQLEFLKQAGVMPAGRDRFASAAG